MSAQSLASRSRASQNPGSDDVVLARALAFSAWAKNNIRLIVIGAVIAVVVVGGLLYYRMYQADRLERAATEFMQLEQTLASGNAQLAQRDLERFATRFEGTPYADEARLALARIHLQEGRAAEAIAALQPAADDLGAPVGAQAAMLLAAAQASAGNTEAAIQTYLQIADEAELPFRQTEALTSAALLRSQAGDFAGAAELFGRAAALAEEGSLERSIYEMRQAEAQAKAAAK
jgi:predicted negative regulator of RcsB-dependent stress response